MQMKARTLITLSLLLVTFLGFSQSSYLDKEGQKHLWGEHELADLEKAPFSTWFDANYSNYQPDLGEEFPLKGLRSTEVTIFLGTWCGDSKLWVPRFIKLWDELGLDRDQLKFIALHRETEHYKQGPKQEEAGLNIHRVPTFIFKKEGKEIARMVESPINSLEADVAQIGLGFPSQPRYRGASLLHDLFATNEIDSLYKQSKTILRKIYRDVHTASELNTYGYVLKAAKKYQEALFTFHLNTVLFRHDPNVYDSVGEMYLLLENYEQATHYYKEVLRIKPADENALKMLAEIEAEK